MSNEDVISALLDERAQFDKRGDKAGVKAVDEQLRFYGHEAAPKAKRSTKRVAKKPEKR